MWMMRHWSGFGGLALVAAFAWAGCGGSGGGGTAGSSGSGHGGTTGSAEHGTFLHVQN